MPNPRDTLQDYFQKRGIRTRKKVAEGLNFVGKDARTTFSQMEARQVEKFTPGNDEVAVLGEAYESIYYKTISGSEAKVYEAVYGDIDYSTPVAEDATARETLDQIFGNNDSDVTGEAAGINQSEAAEIIGRNGRTTINRSSLVEQNEALRRAQAGTSGEEDEDTRGIRGVEEPDSPIEPIA